jgi:general secretion pathway protein D
LASPRIRVINREKAKILIGQKVPTYTTTTTTGNNGVPINSALVTYLEVGLKLEVEPTIFLNNEVAIKVALEVSNVVKSEKIPGTETYVFTVGNRNASTILRLKDGENQILAGLINNETDRTLNKLPGLGDTPLLGKLFGSQADTNKKTEILLSITPRLVRNLQRQEASLNEFLGGTDSNLRMRPDFKVGALEEILSNPAINREPMPVQAPAPNTAQESSPAKPSLPVVAPTAVPAVIQLKDADTSPKPKPAQPDAKAQAEARAEEKRLKDAEATDMKRQLIEKKRAEAAKIQQEKLDKKKALDADKASPETRQFIDKILKPQEAP